MTIYSVTFGCKLCCNICDLLFVGFCLSSGWYLSFKHGATGLVWKSCGLEGAEWRGECPLHVLYVYELVFCVTTRIQRHLELIIGLRRQDSKPFLWHFYLCRFAIRKKTWWMFETDSVNLLLLLVALRMCYMNMTSSTFTRTVLWFFSWSLKAKTQKPN